jgi:hypothetical protein
MARSHVGMVYFMEESAPMITQAQECFTQSCVGLEKVSGRERDVLETVLPWAQGKGREALERMQAAVKMRPREATLIQRLYFTYLLRSQLNQKR